MKKDLKLLDIPVEEGKCFMDVLADLGEKTKNAWITVEDVLWERLKKTEGAKEPKESDNGLIFLTWENCKDKIAVERRVRGWYAVVWVHASDIAFKHVKDHTDPDYFIRLKAA